MTCFIFLFLFSKNHDFTQEDNPPEKVVIVEEHVDGTDIDDIANLEDSLRLVNLDFINIKCGNFIVVSDGGESRNVLETRLKQDSKAVKFFFEKFICALDLAAIYNENIDRNSFWRDDTHPTNEGTSLLSKIFSKHLNSFFIRRWILV